MRHYEGIVIFNPDLNEDQVQEESKRFETLIRSRGVTNLTVDKWGKKEIAYRVMKHKIGNFLAYKFEAPDHGVVSELTNLLRLSDSVIKFQVHRTNEPARKFKGNPKRRGTAEGEEFSESAESLY